MALPSVSASQRANFHSHANLVPSANFAPIQTVFESNIQHQATKKNFFDCEFIDRPANELFIVPIAASASSSYLNRFGVFTIRISVFGSCAT